jgi:hypothetical protein
MIIKDSEISLKYDPFKKQWMKACYEHGWFVYNGYGTPCPVCKGKPIPAPDPYASQDYADKLLLNKISEAVHPDTTPHSEKVDLGTAPVLHGTNVVCQGCSCDPSTCSYRKEILDFVCNHKR